MQTTFEAIVGRIRAERGLEREVPGFDPLNGNEAARFLFVLEAPGAKAVSTGHISYDNPDQTARNFRTQLQSAGVLRNDIALWNVVPWYLGNESRTKIRAANVSDVKLGLQYLTAVIAAMSGLKAVILVGGAARQAHVYLSHQTPARILSCHHPSPKSQNSNRAAKDENIAIFRFMLANVM